MDSRKEWWIEKEITPKDGKWELNDDILLILHERFIVPERDNTISWHFFREPTLRFRIELATREIRDDIAKRIDDYLNSSELVQEHFFASHGKRVKTLNEGFSGESETYKRMWLYQKMLWFWGSEMAIESIKELRETGKNDPMREFQLERIYHLLTNQLNPFLLNEVELYQRCANNRLLVWIKMQSLNLNRQLYEAILKERAHALK